MQRLLKDAVLKMRAIHPSRHTTSVLITPRDFGMCDQVLIRVDAPWRPLQPPYEFSFRLWDKNCQQTKGNTYDQGGMSRAVMAAFNVQCQSSKIAVEYGWYAVVR